MHRYKWLVIGLVLIFSAISFVPAMAFPWTEKIDWESFANAYGDQPVVFQVNTIDDAYDDNVGDGVCKTSLNNCSLRAAIQEANTYDKLQADVIINLPAGTYSLVHTIFNTHLNLQRESSWNIVIQGAGAGNTIIEGNGVVGVFSILYSGTFKDLTVRNGSGIYGGAFDVSNISALTLVNSIVTNNQAYRGGAISLYGERSYLILENTTINQNTTETDGGAINSYRGKMTIRNSTISDNIATEAGGAIYLSGENVLFGVSTLRIENSTISGNMTSAGGAIYQYYLGDTKIFNSTISNNIAYGSGAGGIELPYSNSGLVYVNNSILAGNISTIAPNCLVMEPGNESRIISNGYNLFGQLDGCSIAPIAGDQVNMDPKINPLQNNGGLTQTHSLIPSSPAINGGNPYGCLDNDAHVLTVDQRGFARPGYVGDSRCDIGAYEWDGKWPVYLPLIWR